MKFRLTEFNHIRYGRGADAARVEVVYDDEECDSLWMSTQDIRKNVMLFGPHIGLLEAARHYNLNLPALVASWRAAGDKSFLKPMDPVRDREGWWTHPDWPNLDEGEEKQGDAWLKLIGYQTAFSWLADDEDAGDVRTRWEKGDMDILAWEPKPPAEAAGWFIVSIHDHYDGPVCVWARDSQQQSAHQG